MKKLFLSLFVLILSVSLHAQTTGYIKVLDHGALEKVIRVSTGGYLTFGYDSVWKMHVIRWDDSFNPVWKCKMTDTRFTGGHSYITEANDGNFYFMGSSTENSGCTIIIKFSSSGAVLWQKTYYSSAGFISSYAFSKACGSDNGFIFGGGQCAYSNNIVKCDANGNIEWQQQYGYPLSTGVITCWSIIPDGNNYIISSGYNINSLLTFKIDASGNVLSQSAYTYTGMQIQPTRIIKLNSTGGYAIVGNYNNSNNNKTEFLAIYNSALQLQSFNELTVTYEQFTLLDIAAINNGANIFLAGSIYDNSIFYSAVIYLGNAGNIIWKKLGRGNTSTGNKNVEFDGVAANGNYLVNVGFGYNEGCVFGIMDGAGNGLCNEQTFNLTNVPRTLTLQSSSIYTVPCNVVASTVTYTYNNLVYHHKYVYCGNIGIEQQEREMENAIDICPNPAGDHVSIYDDTKDKRNCMVRIYNASMNLVYCGVLNSRSEINTSGWAEGLYFVTIMHNDKIMTKKMEILH